MRIICAHTSSSSVWSTRAKAVIHNACIWRALNHPHILPFIGLATLDSVIYMVSPWMINGNAVDYVRYNPSADRLRLLAQAGEGIKFLHNLRPGVVHGDIRGVNVLISDSGDACIADFSLPYIDESGMFSHFNESKQERNWAWAAPELLNGDVGSSSWSTDVFSFGRLIYEINTGREPFYELPRSAVFNAIIKGRKLERHEGMALTDVVWALIEECCQTCPDSRPLMDIIVSRLWKAQYSQ
ncbi:hypothetical protein BOTBODRAFT_195364 [Botryobasidium botryosum FD-172 SS1]|uniref:Protein kinase domain-containing protein n=1 Tax=Botryobasidium botryosum (strain FD-172 SS1) TaxID=930990 RepID=A0A067NBP7_BOTB1|nr:hypothetical protein BOTBODRAFT_195364 [Botryobasidium botryosum FD-172 SS1]